MTGEMNRTENKTDISAETLAHMGDGQIAYCEDDPFGGRPCPLSAGAGNRARLETVSRCTPPMARPSCSPIAARQRLPMRGSRNSRPSAYIDQASGVRNQKEKAGGFAGLSNSRSLITVATRRRSPTALPARHKAPPHHARREACARWQGRAATVPRAPAPSGGRRRRPRAQAKEK